ncbi:FAD-dependent oxidoreductase [Nesterenkonia jeotgali]|uniref:Glycine oxidase n=1 Tax=Nesterenkonia jeotgali TaxID=317018 RepID=A0A839FUN2_9MICC|nr:FAD-dependent oxidoreductase [Nesterenkonia jeotgali]MBA8921972.1 glycine oxidase [Nesterenkonia jeotgali]
MNTRANTAVIGAGVIGLLTAWQLRLTGCDVTVISPSIAQDASWAAAGMLAPISEVQYGQDDLWPIMTASRAEYPQFLATLSRATDVPTGYRENGTLLIAADRSDRDAVAELAVLQREHGMEVTALTSSILRRREPGLAPGLSKGWDVPSDHQIDPRQLVAAARAALETELDAQQFPEAGAPVRWLTATVTAVEESAVEESAAAAPPGERGRPGQRFSVTTDDGAAHRFDSVLLIPGLGYPEITGLPETCPLDLRPIHGDVLRLQVTPAQLMPGESHILDATVRAKVNGRSVYLVPRADGGLVIGASSREDGLTGTHAGSVQELLTDAVAVLPGVKDMELTEVTTRARPGTPDERPYLGQLRPGLVVSTGYSRHGILLAPLAARLGAALLHAAPQDLALQDPEPQDPALPDSELQSPGPSEPLEPTGDRAERLSAQDRQLLASMRLTRHQD